MRFITTHAHGYLDYSMGMFLIFCPWMLGFARGGAETHVPVVLGMGALLYSFFTDFELGIVRRIPMPVHLSLDFGSGLLLAISPWLFGFAPVLFLPHLLLGLAEMGASLATQIYPGRHRARRPHRMRPAY